MRGRLPPRSSPLLRLNALCPYYTMFPLSFPFSSLRRAEADDWVLDPFCGRGTTNFAARLRGLRSLGVDSNPVAAAVAQAKFVDTSPDKVTELCARILAGKRQPRLVPSGAFWRRCYHPETLLEICKIREYFGRHCRTDEEIALRAIMLGILHGPRNLGQPSYLSNQMPRTYATKPSPALKFWKETGLRPRRVEVRSVVARRAQFSLSHLPRAVGGHVVQADSREYTFADEGRRFRWVVTSPPYFGMRTYFPDQWLRAWFLGGPDTVTYKHERQLTPGGVGDFITGLSDVWKQVSQACLPGANLIIRFGALPSEAISPKSLLQASVSMSQCGWRTRSVKSAGHAGLGRRQADQFVSTGNAIDEIDLHAVLEG